MDVDDYDAPPSSRLRGKETALHRAAARGDLDGIRAAVAEGIEVDARDGRGRTAAMVATYANQVEAFRLLLELGADVDLRDDMLNNPFLYAGAEGLLEILELANGAGADPTITNRYGGVAVIPAAEKGHVETVRYLLEETAVDVNHVNNLGWTALLEAIVLTDGGPRHQEIVRTLIAHGADVNLPDGEGVTPLQHARGRGYSEIAGILEAAGARE
jgi:ankyrin repeat protein